MIVRAGGSRRVLKIVGIGLGALVGLLLIAVVAIALFVNPNDYKDRIVRVVKSSTGRDLALPGAIKLSVFPWVALELGPASLGNPAGFPDGEFVSVQHVALRVRLLPLLHKDLQIGKIEIDQLDVNLQKNAAGKGNWEDFGSQGKAPTGRLNSMSGQAARMRSIIVGGQPRCLPPALAAAWTRCRFASAGAAHRSRIPSGASKPKAACRQARIRL